MPRQWKDGKTRYTGPIYVDGRTLIPLSKSMTDSSRDSDSDSNANSGVNTSPSVCKNTNNSAIISKPTSKGIVKPSQVKETEKKKEEKKKKLEKVVVKKTAASEELLKEFKTICEKVTNLQDFNTFERVLRNYRTKGLNSQFRVGDQVVFTAGRGNFRGELVSGTIAKIMTKNVLLENCSTAERGSPNWKVTASLLKHTWKQFTEKNSTKNETSDEDSTTSDSS
jgi:hypothetical protein